MAIGAGTLAAGAIARRVAFSGSTGASAASVASTTATSDPRGLARLTGSTLSNLADRVRTVVSDWAGRILAAAGYTKWAGDDPLGHDTRPELYDHVQAEPGTYLSAFEEAPAVDATLGTVRYHLKILEREGLVSSEKVQGKRRYYPIGSSPNALDVALESDSTRALLEALTASPDSVSGLAERIERDPSTVSHHLSRLESEGLVERERDGQAVTNRLTPGVETVLTQGPFAETDRGSDQATADD
ncbi:winged helix-turn-helix transcriptional regulator [Salinigranum sp.]|uniref:winged helix-turn-helix transcriptional regulator n=1 Tax=Salinigranum sp. TaxID=1966351 RepID=UPI003567C7C6